MTELNSVKREQNFRPFSRMGEGTQLCHMRGSSWGKLVMGSGSVGSEVVISPFGEGKGQEMMINEYAFETLTWGVFFSPLQKCLKMLKEFHFRMISELLCNCTLFLIRDIVLCLINHLMHQTWLWMILGHFQKRNSPSELGDLHY